MPDIAYLVSCEHAVNHVPETWRHLFKDREETLETHRASDPGAAELARLLADRLGAPCFEARITRLLVDHNRSPQNRFLWSELSRGLSREEKNRLLDDYYRPFRSTVGHWIEKQLEDNCKVVHLSVHSFTSVLRGEVRQADIGLLYDPRRAGEKEFARSWKMRLFELAPDLRVRCNYPYRGVSDGHQRTYRRKYDDTVYLAFELEINQALVTGPARQWDRVRDLLAESIPKKPM
jgi:predicted N-formylglutamate amidohydrolase